MTPFDHIREPGTPTTTSDFKRGIVTPSLAWQIERLGDDLSPTYQSVKSPIDIFNYDVSTEFKTGVQTEYKRLLDGLSEIKICVRCRAQFTLLDEMGRQSCFTHCGRLIKGIWSCCNNHRQNEDSRRHWMIADGCTPCDHIFYLSVLPLSPSSHDYIPLPIFLILPTRHLRNVLDVAIKLQETRGASNFDTLFVDEIGDDEDDDESLVHVNAESLALMAGRPEAVSIRGNYNFVPPAFQNTSKGPRIDSKQEQRSAMRGEIRRFAKYYVKLSRCGQPDPRPTLPSQGVKFHY